MKKSMERCVGFVRYTGFLSVRRCTLTGSLEHEGERYCRFHHPPTVSVTLDARVHGRDAKQDARNIARGKAVAIREAERRVLTLAMRFRGLFDHRSLVTYPLYKACVDLKELGWK